MARRYNKYGKDFYCRNCNRYGHTFKYCEEPIISLGIINIKLDEEIFKDILRGLIIEDTKFSLEYKSIPARNPSDLSIFCKFKNSIKFLMVRRKNSLGLMEFIRGHYTPSNRMHVANLIQQMVPSEIDILKKCASEKDEDVEYDFDCMWKLVWGESGNKRNKDYKMGRERYEELIVTVPPLSEYLAKIKPMWDYPEWGFPKGRRFKNECDEDCAKREFIEETNMTDDDYMVIDNIIPIVENFSGTNNIPYRHIYYVALATTDKDAHIEKESKLQQSEIGDIGWFTFEEAIKLIRPRHSGRKEVIANIYTYLLKLIIDAKHE